MTNGFKQGTKFMRFSFARIDFNIVRELSAGREKRRRQGSGTDASSDVTSMAAICSLDLAPDFTTATES